MSRGETGLSAVLGSYDSAGSSGDDAAPAAAAAAALKLSRPTDQHRWVCPMGSVANPERSGMRDRAEPDVSGSRMGEPMNSCLAHPLSM